MSVLSFLNRMLNNKLFWIAIVALSSPNLVFAAVEFSQRFAPHGNFITKYEKPYRLELCLNGKWQFQAVPIPHGFVWDKGNPPELVGPFEDKWDNTAIKIPSAWNVNNWGLWRKAEKYDPDPLYFPSYPENWQGVNMAWMKKSFKVSDNWQGRRVILHFDGVAGETQVRVNGNVVLSSHYDSYTPFEVDITDSIKFSSANELLVGVRGQRLFNKKHPEYKWGWDAMGARGSDMFDVCGIYQDVFLYAVREVYIQDVFVKPIVDNDLLEIDVTIKNTTSKVQSYAVGGGIRLWQNLAGKDVLSAPEEKWKLAKNALILNKHDISLKPLEVQKITIKEEVKGRLKQWSFDEPNLYGLLLSLDSGKGNSDIKYTRFGWRQYKIKDGDLYLNGQQIRLYGDILHPFSSFIMSRRTAWAWFTMIKDFGGNAVRPHAQPWPIFYVEMADEMGLAVLDETGVFGSAGGFNMDEDVAWEHCRQQYKALIMRDRNSPSVMGWSFANEMFALGAINKIPDEEYNKYRDKLTEFGKLAYDLDPTRQWISCDGDEDLGGRLDIWSKHWGDGWKDKQNTHYRLPDDDSKPWMLGEYSGSYYGLPHRLDYFNGDEAYESYAGRVKALGIDVYEAAVGIARDKLDYFSASETVWFGLEHLNFGYDDYSRLPNDTDGVVFTMPYQDGIPGMQPERLPPYVATLNPGWDPKLPLYKPLAMFDAMKAALAPGGPEPFSSRKPFEKRPSMPEPKYLSVTCLSNQNSRLASFLTGNNIRFNADNNKFVIVDGGTIASGVFNSETLEKLLYNDCIVMVMLSGKEEEMIKLNNLLPSDIEFTDRQSSNFVHGKAASVFAPMSLRDLYLVTNDHKEYTMKFGLAGPFVENGEVLLEASNIDWALFNAPENRKCASLVLFEKLEKSSGAAIVKWQGAKGLIILCSIDVNVEREGVDVFWQNIFGCLGVKISDDGNGQNNDKSNNKVHDLLRDGPLQ